MIGPENEQLGVMSREDAMAKATEADLDLVEMAPNAKPPVARIMDFGKYQYEQDKQQQKQKKSKAGMVKEVRLTMKISPHDLGYRMERAKGFLEENQKVKLNLMMKGRENANPRAAITRVKELADSLENAKREGEPTRQGRSVSVMVTPDKQSSVASRQTSDGKSTEDGKTDEESKPDNAGEKPTKG